MNVVIPAKIPVWEKSKREKRKNRLVRLIILLISAVVLINLAIKLPGIYKQLNNPLPSFSGKDERTQTLDTSFRTNLLLISYESNRLVDAAVASFEPSDKKITLLLFDLPNNKNIRLPANKAFRENGVRAISKYVSLNLGIILDRYLALENEDAYFTPQSTQSIYKQIRSVSAPLKTLSIRGKLGDDLKTNFSSRELLSLFWKLRGSELDEKDLNVTYKTPDGQAFPGDFREMPLLRNDPGQQGTPCRNSTNNSSKRFAGRTAWPPGSSPWAACWSSPASSPSWC